MFESAVIRKHVEGPQSVDAGLIAETLLFYNNVHILADRGVVSDLLKVVGPDNLLRMLDMGAVSLTYLRAIDGVYTDNQKLISSHRFVSFYVTADRDKRKIRNVDDLELVVEA